METILSFLRHLKQNNNRDWFNDNKQLYEEAKNKFEEFVNILIPKIKEFDKDIDVNSAKECTYRIYRDVRFSKNKEPYKTNFGAYVSKEGRKSKFAGYYIQIEPELSFAGGGVYCPQPAVLKSIRQDIYSDANRFKEIITDTNFKKIFPEIFGDKLKTAPRGFNKDFEDISLLNYKSYVVVKNLLDKDVLSNNFLNNILDVFKTQKPFNDYINGILTK